MVIEAPKVLPDAAPDVRQRVDSAITAWALDLSAAELCELARRLVAIAEAKPDESVEAEPELPRRRLGRAWGWFLRN